MFVSREGVFDGSDTEVDEVGETFPFVTETTVVAEILLLKLLASVMSDALPNTVVDALWMVAVMLRWTVFVLAIDVVEEE